MDERFWLTVSMGEGCWFWEGAVGSHGYGNLGRKGGSVTAHRYAWEQAHGPIPKGRHVLHHCDVKTCVRPSHLYIGTQADNNRDLIERVGKPNAKLTADAVRGIRSAYAAGGVTQEALGRLYGVSQAAIYRAISGKNWADVKD